MEIKDLTKEEKNASSILYGENFHYYPDISNENLVDMALIMTKQGFSQRARELESVRNSALNKNSSLDYFEKEKAFNTMKDYSKIFNYDSGKTKYDSLFKKKTHLEEFGEIKKLIKNKNLPDVLKFRLILKKPKHFKDELKEYYNTVFKSSLLGKLSNKVLENVPLISNFLFGEEAVKILYEKK